MKTRLQVLALFIGFTLPLLLRAQAGLSGDAFAGQTTEREGRNSQFDNGTLKSQSAIGQLEEMTGTTIDRSSSQSNQTTTVTRPAPKPRPAAPHYDPNLMIKQQVAGALVNALFSSVFDDNSAQQQAQAEAEAAARAQAEEEARREREEQERQARIQRAAHYRAEWDARDTEITDRLSGAFDFHPGTSFFGQPANPDADIVAALIGGQPSGDDAPAVSAPPAVPDPEGTAAEPDNDPSVVDLRGSSLVVQPIPHTLPSAKTPASPPKPSSRWNASWPPQAQPPPRHKNSEEIDGLLAYFGPWLEKWYKEKVLEDTAEAALWGIAQRKSQIFGENSVVEYGKALVSFNSESNELKKEVGELYQDQTEETFGKATSIAQSLANPYSTGEDSETYFDELNHSAKKMTAKIYELVFDRISGHFEMPDPHEIKTPTGEGFIVPVNNAPDPVETHLPYSGIKNFLHY